MEQAILEVRDTTRPVSRLAISDQFKKEDSSGSTRSDSWMLSRMMTIAADAHHSHYGVDGLPSMFALCAVAQLVGQSTNRNPILMSIAIGHDLLATTHLKAVDLKDFKISKRIIDAIVALTPDQAAAFSENDLMTQIACNRDALEVKIAMLEYQCNLHNVGRLDYTGYCEVVENRTLLERYKEVRTAATFIANTN